MNLGTVNRMFGAPPIGGSRYVQGGRMFIQILRGEFLESIDGTSEKIW